MEGDGGARRGTDFGLGAHTAALGNRGIPAAHKSRLYCTDDDTNSLYFVFTGLTYRPIGFGLGVWLKGWDWGFGFRGLAFTTICDICSYRDAWK